MAEWVGTGGGGGRRLPSALRLHGQHLPFAVRRDPHPPPAARSAGRPGREAFTISSAGIQAVVGSGDASRLARRARAVEPGRRQVAEGFVARQLQSSMIEQADLVLGATSRHRSAVVEQCPAALPITFGLREFARLAAAVDPAELPAHPVARAHALVELASGCAAGWCPPTRTATTSPTRWAARAAAHHHAAQLTHAALRPVVDVIVTRRRDRLISSAARRFRAGLSVQIGLPLLWPTTPRKRSLVQARVRVSVYRAVSGDRPSSRAARGHAPHPPMSSPEGRRPAVIPVTPPTNGPPSQWVLSHCGSRDTPEPALAPPPPPGAPGDAVPAAGGPAAVAVAGRRRASCCFCRRCRSRVSVLSERLGDNVDPRPERLRRLDEATRPPSDRVR